VRIDLWAGFQEIAAHPDRYSLWERALAWLSLPASFGGGGVMLFFLVSGFCIHLPYVGSDAIEWKPYLARRFWRIYPPYAIAVILTIGCEWLAHSLVPADPVTSPDKVFRTLLMSQNYGDQAGQMMGNTALWSLPVEFELYLAYPVFLWMLRRYGARACVIVSGVVSAIATFLCLHGYPWLEGNFAHYWLIWCTGALLAEGWRMGTLPRFSAWYLPVFAVAGVVAVYTRLKDFSYPIQHYSWAVFYFFLMWGGLCFPQWIERVPAALRRGLLWLGMISYSLYLIHYPLFLAAGAAWTAAFGHKPISFLVPLGASFLLLPIAWIVYRFTEVPSHNFGRKLAKKLSEPSTGAVVPTA
jgi:peptidoglycan/LPS O-acetylase OafA/YrhL